MTTLCRLEYLTAEGWVVGHAGIALLHPERYVERLYERGKYGRVTELDDQLQPTGTVYSPPDLPDPTALRPSNTRVPHVPAGKTLRCQWCESYHSDPFDGSCLI